jgi:hypothetical protein
MILESKSPAEIHLMAHRACETLRARQRAIAREHADRIRQLTELMRGISTSDYDDTTSPTLAGVKGLSLSPDLERLIVNPTDGL